MARSREVGWGEERERARCEAMAEARLQPVPCVLGEVRWGEEKTWWVWVVVE